MAEQLTEREEQVLDHLKKAQELGSTLVEYASAFALDVKELYAVKQTLVRKGVIAGRVKTEEEEKPAGFAPVRVVPSTPGSSVVCRIRHPSGWMVECTSFPEVSWMSGLMAGEIA